MRAESTSDGLWAADLTRDMQSGKVALPLQTSKLPWRPKEKAEPKAPKEETEGVQLKLLKLQKEPLKEQNPKTQEKAQALQWARH